MTPPTQEQIDTVRTAARRILQGIPGVEIERVGRAVSEQPPTKGGRRAHARREPGVQIDVFGWSPSLHGVRMALRVRDGIRPEPEIERFAARQRTRQREGVRLGSHHPFGCRAPYDTPGIGQQTEISHLLCDRAGLAILLEQNDHDPMVVADILRTSVEQAIHERGDRHKLTGTRIEPHVVMEGAELMSDSLLRIAQALPDTVTPQTVGRRLGEVATVHPMLDRRRITFAEVPHGDPGYTWFKLSADNVRIGDQLII